MRFLTSLLPNSLAAPLLFVRTVVIRDWRFLAVTIIACTVAATVASFQYAVYASFVRASSVIPRTMGGDFWVIARSVECFDFPTPFSQDYREALARYLPDARFRRVSFGFVPWRSPSGKRGNVAVVGMDGTGLDDYGFIADKADLERLDIDPGKGAAVQASIADTTLHLGGTVDNMSTFLGAPYVIVPFETGRRMLGMDPNSTAFLVGSLGSTTQPDLNLINAKVARDFPEISVVPTQDFERSSTRYWERKSGAGAAIMLAAILAAMLMVLLLSNGIGRFIQRYNSDLLSLLGHGASEQEVSIIVIMVSVIVSAVTVLVTLVLTPIMVELAYPLLPWTSFRIAEMWLPGLAILAALATAVIASRRAVAAFGPEIVFRS